MNKKLLLLYLGAFLGPFGSGIVFPILNTLADDFSTSLTIVGLSITFFMIPFVIIQIFSGAVSDLYNKRDVVLLGFVIYSIGSFLSLISFNIYFFLLSRVVQGFGSGLIAPIITASLGELATHENRGKIMGGLTSAITLGTSSGPLVGGLASEFSWRYAFLLLLIISLVLNFLFLRGFHFFETKSEKKRTVAKQISIVLGTKNVLFLCASGVFVFLCLVGNLVITSAYLSGSEFNFSDVKVGLVLSAAGFSGIFAGPVAGLMIDKVGRRSTPFLGVLVVLVSILSLNFAGDFFQFLFLFVIIGIGASFTNAALNTISVELIPECGASTTSLYNGFRFFGYALAPIILLPIYSISVMYAYFGCAISLVVALIFILNIKLECNLAPYLK